MSCLTHLRPFIFFLAGLETSQAGQPRLQLTHQQTIQNLVTSQAAALRQGAQMGGAPLILSPRLQGLQVQYTQTQFYIRFFLFHGVYG